MRFVLFPIPKLDFGGSQQRQPRPTVGDDQLFEWGSHENVMWLWYLNRLGLPWTSTSTIWGIAQIAHIDVEVHHQHQLISSTINWSVWGFSARVSVVAHFGVVTPCLWWSWRHYFFLQTTCSALTFCGWFMVYDGSWLLSMVKNGWWLLIIIIHPEFSWFLISLQFTLSLLAKPHSSQGKSTTWCTNHSTTIRHCTLCPKWPSLRPQIESESGENSKPYAFSSCKKNAHILKHVRKSDIDHFQSRSSSPKLTNPPRCGAGQASCSNPFAKCPVAPTSLSPSGCHRKCRDPTWIWQKKDIQDGAPPVMFVEQLVRKLSP